MTFKETCSRVALALLVAATVTFTGCEDGDSLDGAKFRIDPGNVTLSTTVLTVVLTAVGGSDPLVWSVTDASLGAISGGGRSVTYTRTTANGANTVEVRDSNQWLASASITQQAEATALTISPATATLVNDSDTTLFTGAGGVGPYTWSVTHSDRGRVDVQSGWSQALYTRLTEGDNSVIVTDQMGHQAAAKVTQAAGTALAIAPTSSTIGTNGTVVLTASGGSGTYRWRITEPATGELNSTTGSSVVYTSHVAGTDIVELRDGQQGIVYGTITKQ